MQIHRLHLALSACAFLVANLIGPSAQAADDYPLKAITLIVPFAAGGPTDAVARIIAEGMSNALRQPIVVENVVGAGGTIAAVRAKRAPPDGYTIMIGHMGTHAAAVALNPHLFYDPVADFEPLGMTASIAIVLLARRDFPAADFREFIAYLRENSSRLNMGHAGFGSVSFAACLMLNSMVGAAPKMTSFQGTGPAMVALAAKRLDYICDQVPTSIDLVKAGAVKAYVIATPERIPTLPQVATSAEAGMPEFHVLAWNALFAPKSTSPAVVAALNQALVKTLADPDVVKQLVDIGIIVPRRSEQSPQFLAALVKSEILKWKIIVEAVHAAP